MSKQRLVVPQNSDVVDIAPAEGRVQIVRLARQPSPADEKLGRTMDAILAIAERLDTRETSAPGARAPVEPLTAAPNDLRTYPRLAPPILVAWFGAVVETCRDYGLVFPPPTHFSLAFVDGPDFREQDGQTFLHEGQISVYLNLNADAGHFLRSMFHEACHAADLYRFGVSLSVGELEKRADAFVARVFAPPRPAPAAAQVPKPEPVEVAVPAPYRGGRWAS